MTALLDLVYISGLDDQAYVLLKKPFSNNKICITYAYHLLISIDYPIKSFPGHVNLTATNEYV